MVLCRGFFRCFQVLFEDVVVYICRINRILEFFRGNVLLVGVGGSGKQSFSRLVAYISVLDVFQIIFKKGYGISDFKVRRRFLISRFWGGEAEKIFSVFVFKMKLVSIEFSNGISGVFNLESKGQEIFWLVFTFMRRR